MTAVALVSGGLVLAQGIPSRLPPATIVAYESARTRSEIDVRCMDLGIEDPPCAIVAPQLGGAPDVVFWGDSHAGAMLPGIELWLKQQGLTGVGFAKAACAPLPGLVRADNGREHRCNEQNDKVLAYIASKAPRATVILAARWALTVEGQRAPGEAGGPALLAHTGNKAPGAAGNAALAEESLDRLLETLAKQGHRVVLIAGVPEMGFDGAKALAREHFIGFRPAAPAKDAFDSRNRRALAILEKAAALHGATIHNIADVTCAAACRYAQGAIWLYRDDDHLSAQGARLIVPRALGGSFKKTTNFQ